MHTKNISNLIEWLKATHPELLKFFLKPRPGGTELDENYLQENPSRIFTPIAIFEGKIIIDRVALKIMELQKSSNEKVIQGFDNTVDALDAMRENESKENIFTQNVFYPALSFIIHGQGTDEDMEIVQQRFALYAEANTTGSFQFV